MGRRRAMVPFQPYEAPMEAEQSLICGTVFADLAIPYCSGWNLYRFGRGGRGMNQEELLKSLMELDFIAVDLGLFLNTHPDDSDAIAAYNQVITAADTVRMKYEETFGPLCSFRSYAANTQAWQWMENPWPWQNDANFSLAGKECK